MIGYYVHHQGSGHLRRMTEITRHLREPVTVLSSLPRPSGCGLPWVHLERDDLGPPGRDPQAGGTLHWAPAYDAGLLARTLQVVAWVERHRPALVVVDVSVEVTLLVRLTGTPVLVVAMPGDRTDRPHRTAYDAADGLLAAWPREARIGGWPQSWTDKTSFVGAISRFDGRGRRPRPRREPFAPGRATLLWGTGGAAPPLAELQALRHATPGWQWDVVGAGTVRDADEVWDALGAAQVVVSHAGQNVVAELAAARVPAVVVADQRPFDEQRHMVGALGLMGVAVGLTSWPDPQRWPELLRAAQELGGERWRAWSTGDGARRAAQVIDGHVARLAGTAEPART